MIKTNKPRRPFIASTLFATLLIWGSIAALVIFAITLTYIDAAYPYTCLEHSTVKSILSLNYRDATILLENGSTVAVNQATLKPGEEFCVKYDRK